MRALSKTNPRALRPFTPPDTVIEVSWPRRWYSTIGDEASFGRTVPHVMEQVDRHKKDYEAIVVNLTLMEASRRCG